MNENNMGYLQIAKQALKNYSIGELRIEGRTMIGDIGFSGYRMIKFRAKGNPGSFLITVYDAKGDREIHDYQQSIRSHLLWLESLSVETELVVQTPVRNTSGDLLTETQIDGRNYIITLLQWVQGELVWNTDEGDVIELPPEILHRVGATLGQLHQHSYNWSLPENFIRPESESEDLSENMRRVRQAVDDGRIRASDFSVLEQMVDRFDSVVTNLGKTPLNWGLLHGDFFCGNCISLGDQVRPIDFDWCCFGYYAGDIGWALSKEMDAPLRQAFLDGYQQYFELPDNSQQVIGGFFLESHIRILSWEAGNPNASLAYVPYLVERGCKKYLREEPFFMDYREAV